MKVITNITKTNSEILRKWKEIIPFYTGVDIKANEIYSVCTGVVIEKDKYKDVLTLPKRAAQELYVITIQYDSNTCVRYLHLKESAVGIGDLIMTGQLLGKAQKYVTIEYATNEKSKWPVRISDTEYYKHNPIGVITGEIELPDISVIKEDTDISTQTIF